MLSDFVGLFFVFIIVGVAQLLTALAIRVVDRRINGLGAGEGEVETSAELRRSLLKSINERTSSARR